MKLYVEIIKALYNKIFLKNSNGLIIKKLSSNMGIVYVKLAQILATQNIGNIFTEEDRKELSTICDNYKQISYKEIKKTLKKEYGKKLNKIFKSIEKKPLGSASVSQVHKAVLYNGVEVAIKIKRKDITKNMDKDIKKIKKLIHRYGKLFQFGNIKGANQALELYLSWINDEINFDKERENIKLYIKYTESVNGKISSAKKLKVPKVYDEYSTSNVIVMQFIKDKTINKMKLNNENKKIIINAINTYIKLNFWAMFNGKPIAFHGDPHSGNIAIDDSGNLWFLDMGLLFTLTEEESQLCKDLFLTIYFKNYEKLYNMLIIYGNLNTKQKKLFKEDIKKFINNVQNKNVTHYFIDLISVCLKFEFVPPIFLFNMAKAFICIYGICNFSENNNSASELLKDQIMLYIIKNKINNHIDYIYNMLIN